MFRIIITSLLLLMYSQCSSQHRIGCEHSALSNSNIANNSDSFSLFNNPAGLGLNKNSEISFYYSPAPFGLNELAVKSIATQIPSQFGKLGFGYIHHGYDLYREQNFALAYSFNIDKNLLLGISAIYQTVSIKNYGNDGVLVFLLGGVYIINESLNLGFTIYNPSNTSIGNEKNQIPVYFELGASLEVSESACASFSINKELNQKLSPRFGIKYNFLGYVFFLAGYRSAPEMLTGGLAFAYLDFQFGYSIQSHNELGISHQFGLTINY